MDVEKRHELEKRLYERQSGRCFICDRKIDLIINAGDLDIDHIDPLADDGLDSDNNFALTHASCNRSKGASDLRVARRLAEFEDMQQKAKEENKRGANLGDVFESHGGAQKKLRLVRDGDTVKFSLDMGGKARIVELPLYTDKLSGMAYFFAVLPLEYLHHDDRINPRSIGTNIRGLIEEFLKKRPQLHIGLAWWSPEEDGSGYIKIFDGQHKAASQILLGVRELPVRVFVEPDTQVLLQANTNAGDKLRQVAFDKAVIRHLGGSLYNERLLQYQQMRGLAEDDYSFSERDLVRFFKGESREMERYIIDAQRDSITHNSENKLMEFVEWAGKGSERPLVYITVERTFFSEFLYQSALESPIAEGLDDGTNPRILERDQMVRLMSLFAEIFFVGKWDPDIGGSRLEKKVQDGEKIPEEHLRAWRIVRAEVLGNVVKWIRLVMENYFVFMGTMVPKDRIMQITLPEPMWNSVEAFLRNLALLPCWYDKNLANIVFGPKQNLDYWEKIFETGKTPGGVQVLAKRLILSEMLAIKPGGVQK